MTADIEKSKEQLLSENKELKQQLEKSERIENEQLSINQQYEASEQQLKASNQQLAAIEQQLRALNEQLVANAKILHKEKNFSENLLETANSFVVVLDLNANITLFNDYASRISGYGKEEVMGKNWFKLFIPERESSDIRDVFSKVLEKMPKYSSYDNSINCKDNSERFISWQNTVLNDESGTISGVVSIGIDVTDSKKTEAELNKLSAVVHQSPSVIVITDLQGGIQYVNPKFSELTGYTLEEVVGKNPSILNSGQQSNEVYQDLYKAVLAGNEWRGEFHNKKKNQELFWESALISPIMNEGGEIVNYIKVAEDITEHKRSEQMRDVIHNISNGVIITDSLHEFVNLVRKELSAVIDTSNFYIALYDEEKDSFDLPFHFDQHDEMNTIPSGKTLTHYVVKTRLPLLATKKVSRKLIESGDVESFGVDSKVWLGVPLLTKGKVIGAFAVQSYIDEKAFDARDEKVLQIISDQISISIERKRVEEDLKNACEKAQESDKLKSAFLSNMSHEIRTPMNGILGFSDLLKEPGLSGDEQRAYINVIESSGNRMLSTINDIIDISRIEADEVVVFNSDTSIDQLLNELLLFFTPDSIIKGLSLKLTPTLSEDELNIWTDRDKLYSILENLIKNALKYTEEGGVEFGYNKKDDSEIPELEFYVHDTGVGVPDSQQDLIFNRFEQADNTLRRKYEGSGLGLAITKAYVELLGGKIWFQSKEGEGSRFIFTIPWIFS